MSERAQVCTSSGIPLAEEGSTTFPCPDASTPLAEAPVFGTKVCCTSVPSVNLLVPEVIAWAW